MRGVPSAPATGPSGLPGRCRASVPAGIGAYIGYSPLCFPRLVDGVKCVIVDEGLRDVEPMAWDFVMNFARDNDLRVAEACLLPEPPPGAATDPR